MRLFVLALACLLFVAPLSAAVCDICASQDLCSEDVAASTPVEAAAEATGASCHDVEPSSRETVSSRATVFSLSTMECSTIASSSETRVVLAKPDLVSFEAPDGEYQQLRRSAAKTRLFVRGSGSATRSRPLYQLHRSLLI